MKKEFNNADEVVKDLIFKKELEKTVSYMAQKRKMRPLPKNGMKYKRDFFDRIGLENFTSAYFLKNMPDVWNKTSQLGREERRVIQFVCTESLKATFEHYAKIEEPKKPKAKKKNETN